MGVVIVEGERAVWGVNLGRPIVTNGAFATRSSQIIKQHTKLDSTMVLYITLKSRTAQHSDWHDNRVTPFHSALAYLSLPQVVGVYPRAMT